MGGMFTLNDHHLLEFHHVTLLNGRARVSSAGAVLGGAVRVHSGTLRVYDSKLQSNEAGFLGGAIAGGENIELYRSHIIGNLADDSGGVLYVGNVTADCARFDTNSAVLYRGGAIAVNGGGAISNSSFTGNLAGQEAHHIYNYDWNDTTDAQGNWWVSAPQAPDDISSSVNAGNTLGTDPTAHYATGDYYNPASPCRMQNPEPLPLTPTPSATPTPEICPPSSDGQAMQQSAEGMVAAFAPPCVGIGDGLRADYYTGQNFDLHGATRIDLEVDFFWSDDPPPIVPINNFSVVWTGHLQVTLSTEYSICTESDGGIRLWIDEIPLIDKWNLEYTLGAQLDCATVTLPSGNHAIRLEYHSNGGLSATTRLLWSYSGFDPDVIDALYLYSASIPPFPPQVPGDTCAVVPGGRGLTTHRLRQIARQEGIVAPFAPENVQFNQRVGRAFQEWVITLQHGFSENLDLYDSAERSIRTSGWMPTVQPDAVTTVIDTVVIRDENGTPIEYHYYSADFSGFWEVKAVDGNITLGYRSWQIMGFIDAVSQQPAASTITPEGFQMHPRLYIISTSNTTIGQDVINEATNRGVLLYHGVVCEIVGTSPAQLFLGLRYPMNPEVYDWETEIATFPPVPQNASSLQVPGTMANPDDPDILEVEYEI
jgi:hypothetical protein